MPKPKDDDRDVFETAARDLAPVAGYVGGALIGRKIGRKIAKKRHDSLYDPGQSHFKPGDEIVDATGKTKRATQADVDSYEKMYNRKVARGGYAGALFGAGAVGAPLSADRILSDYEKKRRK